LLALTEIADLHTSKNIALNTLKVIREYSFQDNVSYFILDNASSNNTAVNELSEELNFNAT
jgi:hypothetical protein